MSKLEVMYLEWCTLAVPHVSLCCTYISVCCVCASFFEILWLRLRRRTLINSWQGRRGTDETMNKRSRRQIQQRYIRGGKELRSAEEKWM